MNPDFSSDNRTPMFNANSAIIGVCTLIIVGVLGWVGNTTQATSSAVTRIDTQLPYITRSVDDLKTQVSGLVTRAELDSRMKQSDDNNRALVKELVEGKNLK